MKLCAVASAFLLLRCIGKEAPQFHQSNRYLLDTTTTASILPRRRLRDYDD